MSTLHDEAIPRAVQELNQLPTSLTPPPPYEEQPPLLLPTMHKFGSSSQTKISDTKAPDDIVVFSVASNLMVPPAADSTSGSPQDASPASSFTATSSSKVGYRRNKKDAAGVHPTAVAKIPVAAAAATTPKTPRLTTAPKPRTTPPSSARTRIGSAATTPAAATPIAAVTKESPASKKASNSGIPLRLKTTNPHIKGGPVLPPPTSTTTLKTGGGTYNKQFTPSNMPTINKNTLEVQFLNNKKRLLQLHTELLEKQRPLVEMHKSLLRTKKQLEEMGKKVVLEPLKMITLKEHDPDHQLAGSGEAPINEATDNLRCSVEMMIGSFAAMCKKCLDKQDSAVKMLESVSRAEMEVAEVSHGVELLKQEKSNLKSILDQTVCENEKKIADLVDSWQQVIKNTNLGEEAVCKIADLEEKVKQQQKLITDGEENVHHLTRRFEDKKLQLEKSVSELNDKIGKLEDDIKREKKTAAEHVMKTRSLKNKVTEAESRAKESEEKYNDTAAKLRQAQDQLRRKEIQWVKEKDDFKKNEALLQQKFAEKQYHIDARLKSIDEMKQTCEDHYASQLKRLEEELLLKEKDVETLEKDREVLTDHVKQLGDELENMRSKILSLTDKIDELQKVKHQARAPSEERKPPGYVVTNRSELMEYNRKIAEGQKALNEQAQQIVKMQNSLKAHARVAVALKLEKDNAVKFSNKLRDILQEAKDEIESKNRAIYKIHEKLVLKEADCEKLKAEIKDIVISGAEYPTRDRSYHRVRSQSELYAPSAQLADNADRPSHHHHHHHHVGDSEPPFKYHRQQHPQCHQAPPPPAPNPAPELAAAGDDRSQNVASESLLGMSVKKIGKIYARLENLKKITLPIANGKKRRSNYSWIHSNSHVRFPSQNAMTTTTSTSGSSNSRADMCPHLLKQIELRGKLYQILQQHADKSCDDLLELLKKSVSVAGGCSGGGYIVKSAGGVSIDELKPSRGRNKGRKEANSSSSNTGARSASDSFTQLYPNNVAVNNFNVVDLQEEESALVE